jgi:hypothetical protein
MSGPYREQAAPDPHRCTRWERVWWGPLPGRVTFWRCAACHASAGSLRCDWLDIRSRLGMRHAEVCRYASGREERFTPRRPPLDAYGIAMAVADVVGERAR